MALDDVIDGPPAYRKSAKQQRLAIRARHLVYLQLFALIPSVLIGRSEQWGYAFLLEGLVANIAGCVITLSALAFPLAILVLLVLEHPRERWSWAAAPVSIAMSFAQFLAILPAIS